MSDETQQEEKIIKKSALVIIVKNITDVKFLLALCALFQYYLANRNDNNGKDRSDKLRQEQWQQKRSSDSAFKSQMIIFMGEMKEAHKH